MKRITTAITSLTRANVKRADNGHIDFDWSEDLNFDQSQWQQAFGDHLVDKTGQPIDYKKVRFTIILQSER